MPSTLPDALIGRALAEGGATLAPDSTPASGPGFAVGGRSHGLILRAWRAQAFNVTTQQVAAWLRKHAAPFYGSWIDPADGSLDIDAVDILADQDSATALARAQHQQAIYDLAKGATLSV